MIFTIEKPREASDAAFITHCGSTTGAALKEDAFQAIKWAFYKDCPLGICFGTNEVEKVQFDQDSKRHYQTGDTEPCPHTL